MRTLGFCRYLLLTYEGVPDEVLDYLQRAQIDALLWQQYRSNTWYDNGAFGGWTCTRRRH